MSAFSLMYGWVVCAGIGLALSAICLVRRGKFLPLLTLPAAWAASYYTLVWDPFGVLYWYFD
jgi:hypothetical protein